MVCCFPWNYHLDLRTELHNSPALGAFTWVRLNSPVWISLSTLGLFRPAWESNAIFASLTWAIFGLPRKHAQSHCFECRFFEVKCLRRRLPGAIQVMAGVKPIREKQIHHLLNNSKVRNQFSWKLKQWSSAAVTCACKPKVQAETRPKSFYAPGQSRDRDCTEASPLDNSSTRILCL